MDETVPSGLQNLMRREGRKPLFRFVAALTTEYRDNRLLDMLTVLFTERRSALEKEEILYERFGMENTIPRKEKLTNMCNLSDGIYQEGERKGEQRGELKALCNAVVNGMLTLANALKLSGCSQDEFSAWMKQFHPDYKM